MGNEIVVSAEGVSKKFCMDLRRSMTYGIAELAKNLIGVRPRTDRLRKDEFWALKDVNFELRKGEALGLIGPNGSGKTTLLRLLSGIYPPDKGEISIRGRVGALIAVGAGFHPHMTGRENIFLNGAILGLSKDEIRRKFDEIVDFADIGDFLEAPVSTYSSGMSVRLGFSIAIQIDPDVLLIDEILAVGDIGFRMKCYNKIAEMIDRSVIIFVSHAMSHVARYCNTAMLLEHGAVLAQGEVGPVIDRYLNLFETKSGNILRDAENYIQQLKLTDKNGRETDTVQHGDELRIEIHAEINDIEKMPTAKLLFYNKEMQPVAVCDSHAGEIKCEKGKIRCSVNVSPILLNPDEYSLSASILSGDMRKPYAIYENQWRFTVVGAKKDYATIPMRYVSSWENV